MAKKTFKVGDVVALKSYSNHMTIRHFDSCKTSCYCDWFDPNINNFNGRSFPLTSIELIDYDSPVLPKKVTIND